MAVYDSVSACVRTKKPKGLSITRDGFKFTCKWTIADKDYGDGQEFQWRTRGKTGWRKWNSVSCGKTTTSKAVTTLSASDFYPTPNKSAYMLEFQFRVRGNRKAYSEGSGNKRKIIDPEWSDWSDKSIEIEAPPKPNLSAALVNAGSNATTFTWSLPTLGAKQLFVNTEWKTALVTNCDYTDGSKAGYGSSTTGTASNSSTQTEGSGFYNSGNSYTRWFAIRSRGPAGDSEWVYAKHVYAKPSQPTNLSVKTTAVSGGIEVVLSWNSSNTAARPVDGIKIQKWMGTPAAGLTVPAGISWTDVDEIKPKNGSDAYRYIESATPGADQCLFYRVAPYHDSASTNNNPTGAVLATAGVLSAPSNIGASINGTLYKAWVAVENESDIPDSRIAVVFQASNMQPYIAGIIEHGSDDPIVIQCPDHFGGGDAFEFQAYAFVGTATKQTRSDGLDCYSLSAYSGKPLLISDMLIDQAEVPRAPTGLSLSETNISGTVRATWNWTWTDADGTELSWADREDAWESTSPPSTYDINSLHSGAWNISGLESGKRWYVRTRFWKGTGDDRIYGPYSDIESIDLAVAPVTPILQLSSETITADGETTAFWGYVTNDGTSQAYAEICTATISSGTITRGNVIARTETAQSITLKASELGWTSGNTYNLCVRVTSASGKKSDWSAPVPVTVAEAVTCSIASTSLENINVPDDEDDGTTRQVLSLTGMPLTVNISGVNNYRTATVIVERAADYIMERPDGDNELGQEGETIALISLPTGISQAVIDLDDLLGRLDDGAQYRLIVTIMDAYGQSASASTGFEVHWEFQALMPEATVVADETDLVVFITPEAPTGARNDDRVDIYRLSVDKPVLIYSGAEFGETYVDPYPAFGPSGGHRIVYKTKNDDYITADNRLAWIDLREDEGDIIGAEFAVVDFGGGQLFLKNGLGISHSWEKDFVETRYLGGAIQGDWNPGVKKKSTVSSTVVRPEDEETVGSIHRLAEYAGVCNVRTPDGTSFPADVQVSEDSSCMTGGKIYSYKLAITRVDHTPDGMTLEEWEEELEESQEEE